MSANICQCGAVKTHRARTRRRAPRAVVCLTCWRHTPKRLRQTFNATRIGSAERRGAIREILEWLKADHAATLTEIDNLE